MPITFYIVLLVGILLALYGAFVFKGKMTFIAHSFNYMAPDDPRLYKPVGFFLFLIGITIIVLPFILGIDSMKL